MNKNRVAFTNVGGYRWSYYLKPKHWFDIPKDYWQGFKSFLHRGWYGYAPEDLWSLDFYLATWLPSALRFFKSDYKAHCGPPSYLCEQYDIDKAQEVWDSILEKMARGFEAVIEADDSKANWSNDKIMQNLSQQQKEGMALFAEHFNALWD